VNTECYCGLLPAYRFSSKKKLPAHPYEAAGLANTLRLENAMGIKTPHRATFSTAGPMQGGEGGIYLAKISG